jgi:hypothetical protein
MERKPYTAPRLRLLASVRDLNFWNHMPNVKLARLPLTLTLKPGLRWRGRLVVQSREPNGCYAVAFTAEVADPKVIDRYVYDHAVLTAAQLEAWTGWREP